MTLDMTYFHQYMYLNMYLSVYPLVEPVTDVAKSDHVLMLYNFVIH